MNQFLVFLSLITTISCFNGDDDCQVMVDNTKMNGVSWVASNSVINDSHVDHVTDFGANYSALIPFAFMPDTKTSTLQFNVNGQWWGETEEGIRTTAQLFKKQGIKRMLKPQIWVLGGAFVGDIEMQTEEDWKKFEENYSNFILFYAKIAEDEGVELFSIGTEMKKMVLARPLYWEGLITQVREIYKGKLTYAANWDSYQNPQFWSELDYIGVDAYFPLSDKKTPSVKEIEQAWTPIAKEIKKVSEKENRKVIFTEYGYRSVDFTGLEPWEGSHSTVNLVAQQNILQGLFNAVWEEEWFAGGFLWKWFDDHKSAGGVENNRFTVQNKPAQQTVSDWYKSH